MNKKKIAVIILSCTILLFFIYYILITSSIVAIGTVDRKLTQNDKNYIEVAFEYGETKKIRVPQIVWHLIEERKTYLIKYRYNLLRPPFLEKIEME